MNTHLIIWFDKNEGIWCVNEGVDSPVPSYESYDYDDCMGFVRSKLIEIDTHYNG